MFIVWTYKESEHNYDLILSQVVGIYVRIIQHSAQETYVLSIVYVIP